MTNPFLPAQPQQQAPAPATPTGNPFAAPAPATPQGYGTALGVQAPVQQYAPQAPATPAPGFDLSRLASASVPIVGEGRGPKHKDMYGRLLLFFPLSEENVPRKPEYITPEQRAKGQLTQQQITATVVVLDDGKGGQEPIGWGGNPYVPGGQPHTDFAPLPYVRKAMWWNQTRILSQLRPALPGPDGRPGMIAGRLAQTEPRQNAPWYLIGATEPEVTLVRQYLEAVQAGHFPHPLA